MAKWMTAVTVVLGLSACWAVGCSAELPSEPSDYEVVDPKKSTKSKNDDDGDDGASVRGTDDDAPSSPAEAEKDRDPFAPTGGGGTTDGGTGTGGPTTPAAKNAILLDGKPMTISSATAHVNQFGAFYTVNFTGVGAPAKTHIILNFQKTGTGCVEGAKAQQLFLYPAGSSSSAYRSASGPECGLEITAYPTNIGDVASGVYKGKLEGLNGEAGKTHTLEMSFDLKSVPQP
jgi:hypothetical protein